MTQTEIDNARRETAADKILEYAKLDNFGTRSPLNAAIIMAWLRRQRITATDLEPLLDLMDEKSPKLTPWFIRQAQDNTGRQKEFKVWLISNGFTATRMIDYFEVGPSDVAAFAAGFVTGVVKSLTYDNIKSIYDLLGLAVDVQMIINQYELELINKLADAYKTQLSSSQSAIAWSVATFNQKIVDTLTNKKRVFPDYDRANALGLLLQENAQIITHFLADPFVNVMDKEALKVFEFFYQKIDRFLLEDDIKNKAWEFIKQKLYQETTDRTSEKLANYRFFEAGVIAGNGYAESAQILAGLVLLAWGAGKLVIKNSKLLSRILLKMTSMQRVILSSLVIGISSIPDSRLIICEIGALPVLLEGHPNAKQMEEIITKIDDVDQIFVKEQGVQAVSVETAKEISQQAGKTLPAGCSTVPDSSLILTFMGVLAVLRRGKKGSKSLDILNSDTKKKLKTAVENGVNSLAQPLSPEPFYKKIAEELKIKDYRTLSTEVLIKRYTDATAKEFERQITKGNIKVNSKGVYAQFNSFLNKRLRAIALGLEKENNVMIVLIDEYIESGFGKVLDPKAIITFKEKTIKLEELYQMSIFDFYKNYYPEKKLSDVYNKFITALKTKDAALFEKRRSLLEKIFAESNADKRELLYADYEELTMQLNKAIEKNKIVISDKKMESLIFGKLNLEGRCGDARPDLLIGGFEGTRIVFDFEHSLPGAGANRIHLIGTEFYQDFNSVVLGTGEAATTITKDIPYSFSKIY